MLSRLHVVVVFSLAATLSGCGPSVHKHALNEFRAAHPDAIVQRQYVGEGDSDHAFMHFQYITARSPEPLEQMWVYQWQKDKTWRVIRKEGPKPVGAKFSD